MRKYIWTIALALLVSHPWPCWAEVNVAPSCRIRNRPPGRCGWCALETLARHHRLKALYGITNNHPRRCAPEDLEAALSARDVSYRVQYPGHRDQEILRYAVQHSLGAAIGFRELYPGAGGHIVTLVDFTGDGVKVIDPNDADGRIRQMTLARFLNWWDGFALVLEPEAIGD